MQSAKKIKTIRKLDLCPKKYTKITKIQTSARLKIRKGREPGGNHSM